MFRRRRHATADKSARYPVGRVLALTHVIESAAHHPDGDKSPSGWPRIVECSLNARSRIRRALDRPASAGEQTETGKAQHAEGSRLRDARHLNREIIATDQLIRVGVA